MKEPDFITRRRFLSTLAASVVAVGLPLPVGMPHTVAAPNAVIWLGRERVSLGVAVGELIGSYFFEVPTSIDGPRLHGIGR